jgi:NTE family protein
LQATLARLVDFGLINSKSIRLSDAATNARTGTPVYFDNWQHPITSAHIMASASLPPISRPLKSTANIIGMALWCRTRRCNT